MRKKFLYIKPINLEEQKEDKIIKTIPIKTEESLNYFKEKSNKQFDINDNYFKTFLKKNLLNQEENQKPFDGNDKNNNTNSITRNKKKETNLKEINKINSLNNYEFNETNITYRNKKLQRKKNNEDKQCYSLILRNNNINTNFPQNNKVKMKDILTQRKSLHKRYNQDKRIFNCTYNKLLSSFSNDKNIMKEKQTKTKKNDLNIKKFKVNNKVSKKAKLNKIKAEKNQNQFSLYDPISKSLRYKHYTENRKFNSSKNKTLILNNPNYIQEDGKVSSNFNKKIDLNKYLENTNHTDINYINKSLLEHRKENEQNLSRLKKLIFMKKIENNNINKLLEESKSNICQRDKKMFKIKINEKIKNIINDERKKLEESINNYNKKLQMNSKKKDSLFKSFKENQYLISFSEINRNTTFENPDSFDNMNILSDFNFNRENKF